MKRPSASASTSRSSRKPAMAGGVAALVSAAFGVQVAQANEGGEQPRARAIDEVVVTAQKRTQSIQDIPISLVSISSDDLENAGIKSADELTRIVPNLRINRQAQASATAIRIRGVGSTGNNAIDPSVAPFIDGVYIPRGGAVLNSFLDVASVEVLRGPQGTLFGRNATAGAIQINTTKPQFDAVSGELMGEYGNYDAHRVRGIVNVPVSETFALRFAGLLDRHDGHFDNALDGRSYGERDSLTARLSARWQPSDSIDWTVRMDYSEMAGDGAFPPEVSSHAGPEDLVNEIGTMFGPLSPDISDPFDGNVNYQAYSGLDDTQWGVSSELDWFHDSGYQVRWVGSFRNWDNEQLDGDLSFTGRDLLNRNGTYETDAVTQELQLISPEGGLLDGQMDFVAGVYYFQEDYELTSTVNLGADWCSMIIGRNNPGAVPACESFSGNNATFRRFFQDAESIGAFLETKWALADNLDLVVGGRYTRDDKNADYVALKENPFSGGLGFPEELSLGFDDDQFTYRVVLSWFPTDEIMAFANYSTGYKSGGINSNTGDASLTPEGRIFDSESVDNIELGIKSTWLSGLLQLNATAYRMTLDDFQDRTFQDTSFIVDNAGSLRQQGIELETLWLPTDNITVKLDAAYLDSEFTDFEGAPPLAGCGALPPPGTRECPNPQDNTGKRAPFSPEWEFSADVEYEDVLANGMHWSAGIHWQFVDEHFAGGSELSRQTITDAYHLFDARLKLSSADYAWSATAFVQNLTDERYPVHHFTQVLGSALGLVDTDTGETVYRHYLSAPRTYGVRLKYSF